MRHAAALLLLALACSSPPPLRTEAAEELEVPYATAFPEQRLDLYLPAQERFPTVLFVFGGFWQSGSRKDLTPMAKELRSHGFGVVLPSHRLHPPHEFPAMEEDVAQAFAWVKAHIAERGGDRSRVFVMGHGSGGHLVTLLATDARYLAQHGLAPGDIAGVIGLSALVDLEAHILDREAIEQWKASMGRPASYGRASRYGEKVDALAMSVNAQTLDLMEAVDGGLAFARDPKRLKDASPVQHVTREMPRTLLVVGDEDLPKLAAAHSAFAAKARAAGARVELFETRDWSNHMDVLNSLAEPQSPVLARVLAFLAGS